MKHIPSECPYFSIARNELKCKQSRTAVAKMVRTDSVRTSDQYDAKA